MMLKLIRKRKRNWLGHWLRRNCLLKDALEGMVNGRRVRGRRRYHMIDDIKICGSYAETKRKAEIRKIGECWVCSERPAHGQNSYVGLCMYAMCARCGPKSTVNGTKRAPSSKASSSFALWRRIEGIQQSSKNKQRGSKGKGGVNTESGNGNEEHGRNTQSGKSSKHNHSESHDLLSRRRSSLQCRPAQGLRFPSRLTAHERNADISCALYKGGLEEGVISYKMYTKGNSVLIPPYCTVAVGLPVQQTPLNVAKRSEVHYSDHSTSLLFLCFTATQTEAPANKQLRTKQRRQYLHQSRFPYLRKHEGFIKDRVYTAKPRTIPELVERIEHTIQMVTPDVLTRVHEELIRRLHLCIQQNGRHFEN
ncbi:hypothetical protein ANN_10530 [Periplaneta americana]|uniref:Uncharacterized protein n=1 Tax=Periplaneta americana TaxID=6978 RepID=A0ABQ8TPL6_PERAM|nr:hypothetical protein ANN_10530 [Periplaneta americana]